ncbi:MAG TPA: LON peptidase substrate-binding domain-containing protein [Thermoanaerobaculia bacterium]|nr:LON peptidase substrate-binding domain-containing protein [Thermoanaerobaculia bacterium]
MTSSTRLPLFPLPNVVHFPGTPLKLHVFEPRYRRLVKDLLETAPDARLIGMVLTRPGAFRSGQPEIFPGGTAGLLIDVEPLPDGRSNILLHGDFRFEVEREVESQPYRAALVRPVFEAPVDERDPEILDLRRDLVDVVGILADELGKRFPLKSDLVSEDPEAQAFEQLVNGIAAELDVPPLTKMSLLTEALPERAAHLLGILEGRKKLIDFLRPFRHLAGDAELN